MPEFEGWVKRFGALPNDSNIYWIPFKQHINLGRSETRTPLTHSSHSGKAYIISAILRSTFIHLAFVLIFFNSS